MEVSPSFTVQLSQDSYLAPSEFKAKYKTSNNKVGSAEFNNVRFFAIEDAENIYIVFRGTATKVNAGTDLNFKHVKFLNIENTQVHRGFYNIALNSKKILRKLIEKDKPIIITGHSLGGGVATLLGGILHVENKDVLVYSFGSPPVGNKAFVKSIKNLKHQRYVHQFDIIPKINKPIADKLKKYITSKKKLTFLKILKPISFAFAGLVKLLASIPYEFVHQGHLITLRNAGVETKSSNEKLALLQKLFKFSRYHNIATYVAGVK